MENVTQKRTPGEWRELFSSQEFEEAYEYGGDDLGAVYQTQGTDFALWAPTAERAELLLYRAGSAEEGRAFRVCCRPDPGRRCADGGFRKHCDSVCKNACRRV